MLYAKSTAKDHFREKQNVFLPQVNILIHYLIHIPPLRIRENEVEMSREGCRNEVGRSSASRHSMQSYNIPTYYRLKKREVALIIMTFAC